MPKIGEIKTGLELNRKQGHYKWLPCNICGKSRWAILRGNGEPEHDHCQGCGVKLRTPPYTHGDNPQLGDIARGWQIGRDNSMRYQFSACPDCGKTSWKLLVKQKVRWPKCRKCASLANRKRRIKIAKPPYLGEVRFGGLIGKQPRNYMWIECPDCGYQRWVILNKDGQPKTPKCWRCYSNLARGKRHPLWKGDKRLTYQGYIVVTILPENPFYAMGMGGRVGCSRQILEHRLIMAQYLGRCLESWEIVHHKNGIKDDNRIENLELTAQGAHMKEHNKGYQDGYRQGYKDGNNAKTQELLNRIKLLEFHLRESGVIITSDVQTRAHEAGQKFRSSVRGAR